MYPKNIMMNEGRRNGKHRTLQDVKDALIQVSLLLAPSIKNVIFNDPATIVFWSDGTKTVVKCQEGDVFDPEKGLAMAISKKAMGNKRDYYLTFKKWLKKYEKDNKGNIVNKV